MRARYQTTSSSFPLPSFSSSSPFLYFLLCSLPFVLFFSPFLLLILPFFHLLFLFSLFHPALPFSFLLVPVTHFSLLFFTPLSLSSTFVPFTFFFSSFITVPRWSSSVSFSLPFPSFFYSSFLPSLPRLSLPLLVKETHYSRILHFILHSVLLCIIKVTSWGSTIRHYDYYMSSFSSSVPPSSFFSSYSPYCCTPLGVSRVE